VRTYTVKPGDTPAKIAIEFAGCPKCARDLVLANPKKGRVVYPNGFLSFRDLRAGERIFLPDKWFSESFDRLPKAYFAALPYADGVTPGVGDPGVLGNYATLDDASMQVNALASKGDSDFVASVDGVASKIESSVQEAYVSRNTTASSVAKTVYVSTQEAKARNADLERALAAGDKTAATQARLDAQNALSTALGTARIALEVFYSTPSYDVKIGEATIETTPGVAPAPAPSQATSPVPAPTSAPAPAPIPAPVPAPSAVIAPQQQGISKASIFTIGALGVAGVAGSIYYVIKHPIRRKIHRIYEDQP